MAVLPPPLAYGEIGRMQAGIPDTITGSFAAAVARAPDGPALHYFGSTLSFADIDAESDALAALLEEGRLAAGERIMICLQNVPDFVIGLLAAAKLGLVIVPVNPMYRTRELAALQRDCSAVAIIAHDAFLDDVASQLESPPRLRFAVSPTDRQTEGLGVLDEAAHARVADGAVRLGDALRAAVGRKPLHLHDNKPEDTLLLVYTSGTTGEPKAAMLSHRNICAGGWFYHQATALEQGQPILGAAPLFHVTGLTGHLALSFAAVAPVILCYRFQPDTILAAIARHRPTFSVAAITAWSALIEHPAYSREIFGCFSTVFSGGAPISPAIHARFRDKTGLLLHNVYGLTETSAPITASPRGAEIPVAADSGTLSVGKAVPGTTVRIMDEQGNELPDGERGEIVAAGPSVARAYWYNDPATMASMRPEGFRTGDIGVRDANGWVYLVDRKKDMIVASGFKVWPREVEEVIYDHPAVREAAVIGIPDEYRGESVKAVVSLHAGASLDPAELIAFCKARMAAYKYPRVVEIMDELPKTVTGKILRREVR
ncbi:MAG: AMP-binding protein [Pseudomonadota bacterium]